MCRSAVPAGFRELLSMSGSFQYNYRGKWENATFATLKYPKNSAYGALLDRCAG
jgi:hypothetical protein